MTPPHFKSCQEEAEYYAAHPFAAQEDATREDWDHIANMLYEQMELIKSGVLSIPGKNMREVYDRLHAFAFAFEQYGGVLEFNIENPDRLKVDFDAP